jgi:hypothetical protein
MPTASSTARPRRKRQPGSAFKPFVYAWQHSSRAARPTACATTRRSRSASGRRKTTNGKYYGQVTLATALAKSLNSVAAQLAMEVGPGRGGRGSAPHGHRIRAAGQRLDLARHVGGDAARADRRLRAFREWRLQGPKCTSSAASPRRTARCSTRNGYGNTPRVLELDRRRRHDERDDDRRGRPREPARKAAFRLAGGRQDRHEARTRATPGSSASPAT